MNRSSDRTWFGFSSQDSAAKRGRGRRRRAFLERLEQRDLLAAAPLEAALIHLHGNDLQGKDGPLAKAGLGLATLYNEYQEFVANSGNAEDIEFEPSNDTLHVIGDRVVIDIVSAPATGAEAAPGQRLDLTAEPNFYELVSQGLEITGQWGAMTSVLAPIPLIPTLAGLDSLQSMMATAAVAHAGIVDSQGDPAEQSDQARANFGVDGSGITVGALSDSFDTSTFFAISAADDVATGDLPGPGNPLGRTTPVNVLQDAAGGTIDEGRAMLQIVHDVAPGAELAFHTAVLGQASFASGIVDLAAIAGSDVIVDDIIYFAEPMFQDGIIAQAVDQVVDLGVGYFSSAGNANRTSYESAFESSGTSAFGGVLHDFDPGVGVDTFQQVTIGANSSISLSFQWDDPFGSVSTSGAAADTDLDIFLLDQDSLAGNILAASTNGNIGGDPVEILQFANNSSVPLTAHLAISNFLGPNPDLMKYIGFVRGSLSIDDFPTNSSASWGHANATGAESIAAAPFFGTPAFGVSPPVVETFSSLGGTPILFDTAGNRLSSPEVRAKPEVTGPDGGNNTFFINDSPADADLFPNFFGTSASAPHTAAVAALMLDAAGGSGTLTPSHIYGTLESTAIDMDDPFTPGFDVGFDFKTGYGLIDANAAVEAVFVPDPGDPDQPFPVPLTSVDPLGSLIYEGAASAEIGDVGETDSFTIDVDPGQTITVTTESADSLQAKIELFDPNGTPIASATASAPGESALLQTAAIALGGTYTVVVSGVNAGFPGTPDFEEVQTQQSSVFSPNVLNYQFTGTTAPGGDATLAAWSVADLGGSFEFLTVEAEGLVLGDLFTQSTPDALRTTVSDTLTISESDLASLAADGQIDVKVTPNPAVNDFGATQLTLGLFYSGIPADGTGDYTLDLKLNSAIEEEGLGGASNDAPSAAQNIESSFIELSSDRGAVLGSLSASLGSQFEASQTRNGPLFSPESPVFDFTGVPGPAGPGSLDVDALLDLGLTIETLTIDFDGVFSVTIFNEPGFSDADPRSATIPLSQADLAAAAVDGTITVTVTPSPSVNFDVPGDDFLTVTLSYATPPTPGDSQDHYSFDLLEGQPATIVLDGGGSSTLELVDDAGVPIASASADSTKLDQYILNFIAPTTGSYVARVSGDQADEYALVVTRDSAFEVNAVTAGSTAEFITNGGFETGDFTGWTVVAPLNTVRINDGSLDPLGPADAQPPISGSFDAVTAPTGPGTRTLSQTFTVPENILTATLSWSDRIQNFASEFADPNQEFRVVLADASGALIQELFSTNPGDELIQLGPNNRSVDVTSALQSLQGQDVSLQFTEQDSLFFFNVSLDDVSLVVTSGVPAVQNIDPTYTVLGHVEGGFTQQIGVVANNASNTVTVFDTGTDTVIGTVSLPTTSLIGDVEIAPDAGLAFVTDFAPQQVWVIDISGGAPALASGINPIPVSNNAEDLSITPDGKFLLVSDGSNIQPLSVVDIASRTEINTFDPGSDHNSVEVADDGSVLVSSRLNTEVRRFTIDGAGNLTDTGELLDIGGPVNVYPAPGGQTGIVVRFRNVSSFTIPGLSLITSRPIVRAPSNLQSAVFSPDGRRLYVRSDGDNNSGFIDVWEYTPATGDISTTPLFTISDIDNDPCCSPIPNTFGVYFGIDQLALSPDGSKLYVPQNNTVDVFDALTGSFLTSITDPNINLATGVKVADLVEPEIPAGDEYTITVDEVGARLDISTLTPASGPGEFVNNLDPVLTLIDPDGNVVASDDNGSDGRNALISYTAETTGTFTIVVSAADRNGGEYVLDVNRAPEIESISSSATLEEKATEGATVTVAALFTDLNLDDSHTATIDWGDGTSEPASVLQERGGGTISASHEYEFGGIYTVTVTVTDEGGLSDTATTQAVVTGVGIVDGVLQIIGTSADDSVSVNLVGGDDAQNPQRIRVHANFLPSDGSSDDDDDRGFRDIDVQDFGSILMVLCEGNDHATVAGNVDINAVIESGAGDDHVLGGAGNDIIRGGPGKDNLLGGGGLDVLIGGDGRDKLNGQSDADLVSGNIFDASAGDDDDAVIDLLNDIAALREIGDAWVAGNRDTAVTLLNAGLLDDEDQDELRRSPGDDLLLPIDPDRVTGAP